MYSDSETSKRDESERREVFANIFVSKCDAIKGFSVSQCEIINFAGFCTGLKNKTVANLSLSFTFARRRRDFVNKDHCARIIFANWKEPWLYTLKTTKCSLKAKKDFDSHADLK